MGHTTRVFMCYEKLLKLFQRRSEKSGKTLHCTMTDSMSSSTPSTPRMCPQRGSQSRCHCCVGRTPYDLIPKQCSHSQTNSSVPYYVICKCGARQYYPGLRRSCRKVSLDQTPCKKCAVCAKRSTVDNELSVGCQANRRGPTNSAFHVACPQRECRLACAQEERRAGVCSDLRRGLPHSVPRHPDDGPSTPVNASTPPSSSVLPPPNYNPFRIGPPPPYDVAAQPTVH